jgi:transcriptional regulator with XRE-family HTH domain
MSTEQIGRTIAVLRKEKGSKQEELAKAVGVSPQAVSKWENGGTPDTELLPAIADYFSVSIDRLFGRNMKDYKDMEVVLAESLAELPDTSTRISKAYELSWAMQMGICGNTKVKQHSMENVIGDNIDAAYSLMLSEGGVSVAKLGKPVPYFMLLPEPPEGWRKFLYFEQEYIELFSLLAQEDTLRTLFLLYSRGKSPFTLRLLEKELKIPRERGTEILRRMNHHGWVNCDEVELDDEIHTIYKLNNHFSFIPFLIFAGEMARHPNAFYYYDWGRETPLLGGKK